jgi:deoxyribodipyrimidine photo-lyase
VFCFDDRLLDGRHASGPRTRFLRQSLHELARALRARGSGLVLRHGDPVVELVRLARETGATEVHATAELSPYARARDAAVARELALTLHPGRTVVDDVAALSTKAGRPFTVFTPFYRVWLAAPRRPVLTAPDEIPPLPGRLKRGRLPSWESLSANDDEAPAAPRGGETAGRERLEAFLRDGVDGYDDGRDAPAQDGTSRLSPYLHLGCVSAREVESRLPAGAGAAAFARQLCWRDFHIHVLHHFPANAGLEFQPRFRGTLRWRRPGRAFDAWRDGTTGFPLVDAGMRQLRREGWMHNRVRLVVGSFLTKDLGIDWREGERHFMAWLVDGDEAVNNGNWQWIASVGTDPAPAFRRLYNPTLQMARLDPDGAYVRRHVTELRAIPARYLREPWTMPLDVQRAAGCMIGRDYPRPIVDHASARRDALARYREATVAT